MKQYAKLISNTEIEHPPINKGTIINYNLCEEALLQDGYKEFIPAVREEGKHYKHSLFKETENQILEILVINTDFEKEEEVNQISIELEELGNELRDLDLKRIRAICEPSVKDESSGQTWLEYYNAQILNLRSQIQTLQERMNQYDIID